MIFKRQEALNRNKKGENLMATIYFYHGKSLEFIADYSQDVINYSFTIGLNGSLKGSVTIQETSTNATFLSTLKENSHFIKFGLNKIYPGIIENSFKEKGVYNITFIGCYEYLDKIDAIVSHKATITSAVASESNYSYIKTFYSDSTVGVFFEALKNLTDSMTARGFNANLFDYSSIISSITSDPNTPTFNKSYRLNSMETPTMQSVIDDILKDEGMELLEVSVNPSMLASFKFIFTIIGSSPVKTLNESIDSVFNISFAMSDSTARAYSIAKGTDLQGSNAIERVNFDSSVAYSSLINTAPQERSNAINRVARSRRDAMIENKGNISFTSFNDDIDLLDYLTITSPKLGEYSGIIVEKNIEGAKVSFTIQLGEPQLFNGAFTKPNDTARRIIFNKLDSSTTLGIKTAGRQANSTGWRS